MTDMLQRPDSPKMKAKHQRLILALLALLAVIGAGLLAASALKDEAAYFYSPSDIYDKKPAPGEAIRLGGMVKHGTLRKEADGVTIRFVVSDGDASVPVRFKGIAPDLFKEGSGMVADGTLGADRVFVADKILAKHDENYMPPQMADQMTPKAGAQEEADNIAESRENQVVERRVAEAVQSREQSREMPAQ